jgi:uncharacterized protein HemX
MMLQMEEWGQRPTPPRWRRIGGLTLALALGLGGWLVVCGQAEEYADDEWQASERAASSASAADQHVLRQLEQLEKKLDTALEIQQTILTRLDEIREELTIVKIRATMAR